MNKLEEKKTKHNYTWNTIYPTFSMLSRKVVNHENSRNICVAICFGFRKNICILTGLIGHELTGKTCTS